MDTICIGKSEYEKFGDIETALLYVYFDQQTAHGKKIASLTEADIINDLMGIIGVPRFRRAVKTLKKMGYLKMKRTFGGKPLWTFNRNGAGAK